MLERSFKDGFPIEGEAVLIDRESDRSVAIHNNSQDSLFYVRVLGGIKVPVVEIPPGGVHPVVCVSHTGKVEFYLGTKCVVPTETMLALKAVLFPLSFRIESKSISCLFTAEPGEVKNPWSQYITILDCPTKEPVEEVALA